MASLDTTDGHQERSTRREIVWLTAAGVGLGLMTGLCRQVWCEENDTPGEEGQRFDVGGRAQEIIEEAYRLGHQYEKQYGGCAQCTLAALQDAIPFLVADKGLFQGASCLDGGATPTGLQNCGSFTGAGMAIGYLCGRRRNAKFQGTTKQSHKLIRELYKQYEEHYGSVLCKDVREKAERDCPEVVGLAAKWTAQLLLDEFSIHRADNADAPSALEDNKDREVP
ncbi:MAG: C_GCAxxG_C_C family protein [Planctomycetes bacterium]|nr:C_GCAxxG_C_C family protein [Planctomycetota bacterium]